MHGRIGPTEVLQDFPVFPPARSTMPQPACRKRRRRWADTATPAVRPARSGASGEQKLVAAVQDQLAKRGYVPGNATGHLDFVTRAAIMAFEHDKGLELTAVPTGDLLAALRSSVPTPAAGGGPDAASAEAQEVVRAVQRSLSLLNYRPGTVDGVMGKATSAAIRAFERDQKLPESGRISGLLVTRLARIGVMDRVAAR